MELTRDHYTILDFATEDYFGLWEFARQLSGRSDSDSVSPEAEKRICIDLLNAGLIDVFVTDRGLDPVEQLPKEEAISILSDSDNWAAPDVGGLGYAIGSTEEGDRAYSGAPPGWRHL